MNILKGFALITAFSVFFLKLSYLWGFLFGGFKSFLSRFCVIGVSRSSIDEASSWVVMLGLLIFSYFIYQKFFR